MASTRKSRKSPTLLSGRLDSQQHSADRLATRASPPRTPVTNCRRYSGEYRLSDSFRPRNPVEFCSRMPLASRVYPRESNLVGVFSWIRRLISGAYRVTRTLNRKRNAKRSVLEETSPVHVDVNVTGRDTGRNY